MQCVTGIYCQVAPLQACFPIRRLAFETMARVLLVLLVGTCKYTQVQMIAEVSKVNDNFDFLP